MDLVPLFNADYNSHGISGEALTVSTQLKESKKEFIGESLFVKELFKQKAKRFFNVQKGIWEEETMFASSISEVVNNGSYRAIINYGEEMVPFIIDDLVKTGNHWFYALEAIFDANPIKEEHRGNIKEMSNDWKLWLDENYLGNEDSFTHTK